MGAGAVLLPHSQVSARLYASCHLYLATCTACPSLGKVEPGAVVGAMSVAGRPVRSGLQLVGRERAIGQWPFGPANAFARQPGGHHADGNSEPRAYRRLGKATPAKVS